jgi:regulator of sigma E protease
MTTVTAIVGIGILIFLHEWGHFIACRLTKTRTETFSIGFGRRLFGWERLPGERRRFTWGARKYDPSRHAMDFRVSLIPLGGYVKMAGENPGERSDRPDEFPNKPALARIFIICAGVIMNALTALVLYFAAFAGGMQVSPSVIGGVEQGSAAWKAGVRAGDRVTAVGDTKVRTFYELQIETVLHGRGEPLDLHIERDGTPRTLRVVPEYVEERGALKLGVVQGQSLWLKADGATLTIGADEEATVQGVPVLGGVEAIGALREAVTAGADPVVIEKPDGSHLSIPVAKREVEKGAPPKGPWRIGVASYGSPTVTGVRGAAAERIHEKDVLVAAEFEGGTALPLQSFSDYRSLRFRPGLLGLRVRRGDTTTSVAIDASGPAAKAAWLDDVSVTVEPTNRVTPMALPDSLSDDAESLVRYATVPAVAAGLKPGDAIVSIGGKEIATFEDILARFKDVDSASPLAVVVRGEDGTERTLSVVPARAEPLAGFEATIHEHRVRVAEDVGDAAGLALQRTERELRNVFRLIGSFFSGSVSFHKNIGGPVTIVNASSTAAASSFTLFLALLAYISVSLAVLNILPIPLLDGGHLLFLALEKIKGAPLKESTIGKLQIVGLLLILALLGVALTNDIHGLGR